MRYAKLSLVAVAVLLVSLSIQSAFAATLTLHISATVVAQGQTLTLSGNENPATPSVGIVFYQGSTCSGSSNVFYVAYEDVSGNYQRPLFIDPALFPVGVYSAQAQNQLAPAYSDCVSFTVVAPTAVGGVVMPANTLASVVPWVAVVGLVGCIGTVVVVARKRGK